MTTYEVLVFPAGVQYGHAFSSPVDAVTWLCNAASGAFGPMGKYVMGLEEWNASVEATLRPLYPPETPYPIPAFDDVPRTQVRGNVPVPISEPMPADYYPAVAYGVNLWRTATGGEVLIRKQFDAADRKTRSALAPILGAYEDLEASTGAAFVAAANKWITTAWTDALNGPHPVVPDPTPGHVPDPYFIKSTAVGTIRIGVPTTQ